MAFDTQSYTHKLVNFITNSRYVDLPKEVVGEAKRVLLDSLGCALAGIRVDKGALSVQLARKLGGKPESTIIGAGNKVSSTEAAFANGELINALDMDAILYPGHVTPYVIPAPLAIAESNKASGKELILAIVLGHEISIRLGESLRGPKKYLKEEGGGKVILSDVHGLSSCIFGGTAGVSKILKFDYAKTANAIGIAGHICPVPSIAKWQNTNAPSGMAKYLSAGWLSQAEVSAALLADLGYTADNSVLDGDYGFWKFYASDKWRPDKIENGLGEEWRFLDISYKPYPCCRLMHGALDSFIKIIDENNIKPTDIARVSLLLDTLTDKPLWHNCNVRTHLDAQFSVPYVFAVAAHRIKIGVDWQTPATISNPRIREFMDKVEFKSHPNFEEEMLKRRISSLSTIEVVAKGRIYTEEKTWMKGDSFPAEARMTDEELISKFKNNAQDVLPLNQIEELIESIFNLEKINNVCKLSRLFSIISPQAR